MLRIFSSALKSGKVARNPRLVSCSAVSMACPASTDKDEQVERSGKARSADGALPPFDQDFENAVGKQDRRRPCAAQGADEDVASGQ